MFLLLVRNGSANFNDSFLFWAKKSPTQKFALQKTSVRAIFIGNCIKKIYYDKATLKNEINRIEINRNPHFPKFQYI